MRLRGLRSFTFSHIVLSIGCAVIALACSVYDGDNPEQQPGVGGTGGAGNAGVAGNGGSGGTGTGGTSGGAAGATSDADTVDVDATTADVAPPRPDALGDSANDTSESGSRADGGATDTVPPSDSPPADVADVSTDPDASLPTDAATDAPLPDADVTTMPDAAADRVPDADARDAVDSGPTGPQVLPPHGTAIENADAGGPFESRCAIDEVVTGFVGRAGVQTDAIASTCSRLVGGVLSAPRNLPLSGNLTGGNPFTVTCPANHVAVGIVGRYGHNTMWKEDVTTAIGVVCKNLGSTATQIVTITGQPALDAGYTSFREDCTGGRFLTVISGRTDGNSLGYCIQQVGGECNVR